MSNRPKKESKELVRRKLVDNGDFEPIFFFVNIEQTIPRVANAVDSFSALPVQSDNFQTKCRSNPIGGKAMVVPYSYNTLVGRNVHVTSDLIESQPMIKCRIKLVSSYLFGYN